MSPIRTAALGGMMISSGPIAMALLNPALPAIARHFGTDEAQAALTLTLYLLGFGATQLVLGPLSDRFGRKPVALSCAVIYLSASLAALFVESLTALLAIRLAQGVGAASGLVISRAVVRDGYSGEASARIFSRIAVFNAIMPLISPALGAFTIASLGWEWIFVEMAVFGGALVVAILLWFNETLPPSRRSGLAPARISATYLSLISARAFAVPALIMGLAIATIYTASALLPFIIIDELGYSAQVFGVVMGLQTASYLTASIICSRLLGRLERDRIVLLGCGCFAVATAIAVGLGQLAQDQPVAYMLPVMIWVSGTALCTPCLSSFAMEARPDAAGSASALLGCIQITVSFFGTLLAGLLPGTPGAKFALVMLGFLIMIAIVLPLRRRR